MWMLTQNHSLPNTGDDPVMTSEKLIDLEMRFTHQEKTVEQLSEVVFEQGKLIEELKLACASLAGRLSSVAESIPRDEQVDEKPPHY